MKRLLLLPLLLLTACATTIQQAETYAHNDLTTAASKATAANQGARAAVWTAIDARLTADENIAKAVAAQAKQCEQELKGMLPNAAGMGPATLIETALETAGTGTPAACKPIPIPPLLVK